MTTDERTLLLTVARVLRAWAIETGDEHGDADAISEALRPFDPVMGTGQRKEKTE